MQATISVGEGVGKRHTHTLLVGCKLVQPLWAAVWRGLRKLGMEPPFDPAIPLLGLYPKDLKSAYYRDTATSMCIAAQFTIINYGTNQVPFNR